MTHVHITCTETETRLKVMLISLSLKLIVIAIQKRRFIHTVLVISVSDEVTSSSSCSSRITVQAEPQILKAIHLSTFLQTRASRASRIQGLSSDRNKIIV
ncbi:hypothetical protein Ahy_A07g037369 isoform C [Arachis hypogaea]|uniref:Uncharacterized protein n=1 Tax=Arachis hypogaea TaxID=3818 RepID=A0A445CIM4_ARAHY|nr:hypothetical protein Ahy_A07g037369 isoform C [Arachis hypogaea]